MSAALPSFSIVVPTYRRPGQLAECLRSLACLDYHQYEVIVVNDHEDGLPEAMLAPFRSQLRLTSLAQVHAGPAAARNAGADRARGEYLAFIDDDCTAAPGWLAGLAGALANTPDGLIGGRTVNALPENPYAAASQLLIDYLYSYFNADPERAQFFASNNMAMPARHFRALGGFDRRFRRAAGEDRQFCHRWLCSGRPMCYAPAAVVSHWHPLTLRSFWRQHFNYGCGALAFRREQAAGDRTRLRLEPWSFYPHLLRYPLQQAKVPRALVLAALLGLSQAATAVGFCREWLRSTPTKGPCPEPAYGAWLPAPPRGGIGLTR